MPIDRSATPLDPATHVGSVALVVSDLERSVAYYRDAIGLTVRTRDPGSASLGTPNRELVQLTEVPGAPPASRHTGLFHLAIRVPNRSDLAAWLLHAAQAQVPLAGMSDHFVSEAVYLQDPDDHGIEIYHDRPRDLWEHRIDELTTAALDVDDLLGELSHRADRFEGLPEGTDMGHVHLRVRDIPETVAFYRDIIGFDLMTTYGPHAAFLAAGGYHHHIGANVWQSLGASPPPPGSACLHYITVALPNAAARNALLDRIADSGHELVPLGDDALIHDPSANAIRIMAA
jgi:catechol 2,3-dioxygenase